MSSSLLRHVLVFSLVVFIALLMIGCASPEEDIIPPDDMEDILPPDEDEEEEEEPGPAEVEINIIAGNGFFDPDAFPVEQGTTVHVTVENVGDIVHTFTIDEFDVHVSLDPGEQQQVTFTATEAGTFEFYCAEPGHREGGMYGTLTVE